MSEQYTTEQQTTQELNDDAPPSDEALGYLTTIPAALLSSRLGGNIVINPENGRHFATVDISDGDGNKMNLSAEQALNVANLIMMYEEELLESAAAYGKVCCDPMFEAKDEEDDGGDRPDNDGDDNQSGDVADTAVDRSDVAVVES